MPMEDQFLEGLVAIENRMVTLVSLAGLFGRSAELAKKNIAGDVAAKAA